MEMSVDLKIPFRRQITWVIAFVSDSNSLGSSHSDSHSRADHVANGVATFELVGWSFRGEDAAKSKVALSNWGPV